MKPFFASVVLGCSLAAQNPSSTGSPLLQGAGGGEKVTEFVEPKAEAPGPWFTPMAARPGDVDHLAERKVTMDTAVRSIENAFQDPAFVLFDQPEVGGPLWVVGNNYKASFDAEGWTFIPQPAADAEELEPIRFRLAGVRVGGQALRVADVAPVRTGRRVSFAHGDVVQAIDATGRGVEQTFTFAALPQRGEIVVDIALATDLVGQTHADGIVLTGAHDRVTYSKAIAIDAGGARIDAETVLAAGRITIRVPAAFVESARLPLCIDPWVNAALIRSDTTDLGDPDIAWDEGTQTWAVVWARYFGANDWDCYVQRIGNGNPMQLAGGPVAIDTTTAGWMRPRIAGRNWYLNSYQTFLVVAQVRSGTTPKRVSCRAMETNGFVPGPQFVIASSSVDELNPDVGGNPVTGDGNFLVVWQHAYSATDHDIYARLVNGYGQVVGSGPIYVQTNTTMQSMPSVSKACGNANGVNQRWGIVYQQTVSASDQDIYGALLTTSGTFVLVNGSATFPIDRSVYNDINPQVSSPTIPDLAGKRLLLVAYERTNINSGDICATCIDHSGVVQATGNVNVLEGNGTRLPWPQRRPSVDSDGRRFAVAYHEIFNGNLQINDNDTHVSLIAVGNGVMLNEEPGVPLAVDQNRQFNTQIASRYSSSGYYSPRYCTTHDRDNAVGTGFAIDVYSYDGIPILSGMTTRQTGCGQLTLTASGRSWIGESVAFALNSGANLAGHTVGLPASIPLGPCAGCTLGTDGTFLAGRTLTLSIPLNQAFIGAQVSVQGIMVATTGPCLGQIHLSDTVDLRVQ